MRGVSRQEDMIAGSQLEYGAADLQDCGALHQQDPLIMVLIIDAVVDVVAALDALDDNILPPQQLEKAFSAFKLFQSVEDVLFSR